MAANGYTFGDSALAAQRLALVAEMYAPTTTRLLDDLGLADIGLIVDLGCGPGHSTALLGEQLAPRRLVGVEASASFAELARSRLGSSAEIVCADVRALPDDIENADLLFGRLLVTHLADPAAALRHWLGRLGRPDGRVVLEEVDEIATGQPVLARYLDLQARMLQAGGHRLSVGRLAAATARQVGTVTRDEQVTLTPSTAGAAAIFAMNFAGWRGRPVVAELAGAAELDAIERGLAEVAADPRADAVPITWTMRHLVVAAR